jgi:hypothetical protein
MLFTLLSRSGMAQGVGDLFGVAPRLFQSLTLTLFEREGKTFRMSMYSCVQATDEEQKRRSEQREQNLLHNGRCGVFIASSVLVTEKNPAYPPDLVGSPEAFSAFLLSLIRVLLNRHST